MAAAASSDDESSQSSIHHHRSLDALFAELSESEPGLIGLWRFDLSTMCSFLKSADGSNISRATSSDRPWAKFVKFFAGRLLPASGLFDEWRTTPLYLHLSSDMTSVQLFLGSECKDDFVLDGSVHYQLCRWFPYGRSTYRVIECTPTRITWEIKLPGAIAILYGSWEMISDSVSLLSYESSGGQSFWGAKLFRMEEAEAVAESIPRAGSRRRRSSSRSSSHRTLQEEEEVEEEEDSEMTGLAQIVAISHMSALPEMNFGIEQT